MKFKKILDAIIKEIVFFLPTNGRFCGSPAGFNDKIPLGAMTSDREIRPSFFKNYAAS